MFGMVAESYGTMYFWSCFETNERESVGELTGSLFSIGQGQRSQILVIICAISLVFYVVKLIWREKKWK